MTREEAINILSLMIKDGLGILSDNLIEAYMVAIKALEQEPCEDAISRQEVLDMMQMRMSGKELYKAVYDLPSVNPQETVTQFADRCRECGKQKSGRWISVEDKMPEEYGEYMITWVSDQTNKPLISIAEYEPEIDQWTLDDYINNAYTGVGVIAWMPLPTPYEPQESEEQE